MKTCTHLWQYLAEFFLQREMLKTKVVEKNKTHILFPVTSRRSCRLWDNVDKLRKRQRGHSKQYNTAHALCMPHNENYRHTLGICNTYCFFTATAVARTRLGVRLRLKRDGTRAETRFRLSPKRTSPFKSAGVSVQSTAGSRDVRISASNAGYTTFRGGVRVLASHFNRQFPLHFLSRASPCAIRFQTHSYVICFLSTFAYLVLAYDAASRDNRILTFRKNGLDLWGALDFLNKHLSKGRDQVSSRRNVPSQNDVIPSCTAAKISKPSQHVSALMVELWNSDLPLVTVVVFNVVGVMTIAIRADVQY